MSPGLLLQPPKQPGKELSASVEAKSPREGASSSRGERTLRLLAASIALASVESSVSMAVSSHGLLSQNSPNDTYVSKVRFILFCFLSFLKMSSQCQRVHRK